MALVVCPKCGEDDRIRGERSGDTIRITCEVCSTSWDRDVSRRCIDCKSERLRYSPIPTWSAGRGTMQTPSGERESWTCKACGKVDCTRKD